MYTISKVSDHIGIINLILVSYQNDNNFNDTFMMILIRIELF